MGKNQLPNIILVLTDDLGYGDVSCLNPNSKIHTPNIDRLAAEGMAFTDMHASSSVCSPSRYALLTGRYNWRSRTKFGVLPGTSPSLIEDGRLTMAEMLRGKGYRTACVGKWHLGMKWHTAEGIEQTFNLFQRISDRFDMGLDFSRPIEDGPVNRGFDYFFGTAASLSQAPYVFIENDMPRDIPHREIGHGMADTKTAAGAMTFDQGPIADGFEFQQAVPTCDKKVLELIDEYAQGNEPFFLYYPTLAVHSPLVPADEFVGKSGIGPYGDFVLQVDHFMGKLDARLEERGLSDNTIVIFTSDNGCSHVVDFPHLKELGHNPSYVFRGAKSDIWEGGHRVPFLMRWPGRVASGSACSETICLTDLFATFADLTGYPLPDNAAEDSFSFLPLMKGGDSFSREYTVHHSVEGCFSIRKGDWKLEMCAGSGGLSEPTCANSGGLPPVQLYNLKDDVGERSNLCAQYPQVERELRDILTACIKNGRSTCGSPQENAPADPWPGLEWITEYK